MPAPQHTAQHTAQHTVCDLPMLAFFLLSGLGNAASASCSALQNRLFRVSDVYTRCTPQCMHASLSNGLSNGSVQKVYTRRKLHAIRGTIAAVWWEARGASPSVVVPTTTYPLKFSSGFLKANARPFSFFLSKSSHQKGSIFLTETDSLHTQQCNGGSPKRVCEREGHARAHTQAEEMHRCVLNRPSGVCLSLQPGGQHAASTGRTRGGVAWGAPRVWKAHRGKQQAPSCGAVRAARTKHWLYIRRARSHLASSP